MANLKLQHYLIPLCLALFMAIGAGLRLWNIPGTSQFLGDQGRDTLIVSKIFREGDLVFIGPVTSVGNMYLGPLYYYLMVPFLWLTFPNPLGPAYFIAVLSIITIGLMYYLGKELVGPRPALIAAGFMALSNVVVEYSRFSWNPNPAPLVSLVMMWCLHRAWTRNLWYWVGVAACFSVLIQLHYLTLLSGGAAGVIWIWMILEKRSTTDKLVHLKKVAAPTVISILIFLLSLTPLVLFDLKHNFLNVNSFKGLLTEMSSSKGKNSSSGTPKWITVTKETHGRGMHILFEPFIGQHRRVNTLLLVFALTMLIGRLVRYPNRPTYYGEVILLVFLFTGIVGTAFYHGSLFHHYIAYLFPVTFFIYGVILSHLFIRWYTAPLALAFIFYFVSFNYHELSTKALKVQHWNITAMQTLSKTIYDRVKPGEKYDIVLLSKSTGSMGDNYRYFLVTSDRPPVTIDQQDTIETLFIINEDKVEKPTDSPESVIVTFPDKNPKEVYNGGGGIEIIVLRRD